METIDLWENQVKKSTLSDAPAAEGAAGAKSEVAGEPGAPFSPIPKYIRCRKQGGSVWRDDLGCRNAMVKQHLPALHRAGEPGCGELQGTRWGWGAANQGVRTWQRCFTSSVTLRAANLFNVLVNQDLHQNRGFEICPFAWHGELKEQSSHSAPECSVGPSFPGCLISANESLPLFHKMGINKPLAIRIMFFEAVGWKSLYKSTALFW